MLGIVINYKNSAWHQTLTHTLPTAHPPIRSIFGEDSKEALNAVA